MTTRLVRVIVIACVYSVLLSSCLSQQEPGTPVRDPESRPPSPAVSPTRSINATGTPNAISALQATRWQLVSLDEQQLADDTTITLEIGSEGTSGDLVCNSYGFFATFADDGTIVPETGPAGERWVMSAEGCTTATLTLEQYIELADRYLTTLKDATSYQVESDTLRLRTPDGRTLVYERD